MTVLRANFLNGTLTSGVTDSDTSISSSALSVLPVVADPDVAYLVLGGSEIVKVTAHTAASTTATVVRGQDSTTAIAHDTGASVVLSALARDLPTTTLGAVNARSGYYYMPLLNIPGNNSFDPGTYGQAIAVPILLRAGTLDQIAIHQRDAATANELIRLGIYGDADSYPGALLVDAGTVDMSGANGMKAIAINQAVGDAVYWLVVARQGSAGTALTQIQVFGGGSTWNQAAMHANIPALNDFQRHRGCYTAESVTGALPNPWPSTIAVGNASYNIPHVGVRYA